jgi:hypothetical protein
VFTPHKLVTHQPASNEESNGNNNQTNGQPNLVASGCGTVGSNSTWSTMKFACFERLVIIPLICWFGRSLCTTSIWVLEFMIPFCLRSSNCTTGRGCQYLFLVTELTPYPGSLAFDHLFSHGQCPQGQCPHGQYMSGLCQVITVHIHSK